MAARDLPAGHALAAADLTAAQVSPEIVPDGHLAKTESSGLWIGRQVSGPVRRGEVMTDSALLGEELLIGSAPGSQAVPLRLADAATVQLLRQGQLVNVVLSANLGLDGPASNEVLARAVPVLWTPALAATNSLLPGPEMDGLVVVAATPDQATLLAGASARGKIFLVMVK